MSDPIIQEENLRTHKIIFTWDMGKHVPLSDSVIPAPTNPGQPWDVFHMNSIDVSPDGSQLLVSTRNTWGIYDISHKTGQILWELGGKQNQFNLPSDLIRDRPIWVGVSIPARCTLRAWRDQPV